MDYKNLSQLGSEESAAKEKRVADAAAAEKAKGTQKQRQQLRDSRRQGNKKPEPARIKDARMKNLKVRIKDSLESTETTEAAIEALTPFLESDDPEEVLVTVVSVMAESIDALEEALESGEEEEEEEEERDDIE